MESLFTRTEIITFKIIGWVILLITGLFSGFISIWLFYKNKKETKKLEEELKKEIINRKDSEKKTVEHLYQQEKENREWHCKKNAEREREIHDLRKQLREKGVPHEEHNISDVRKRKEAVLIVERCWHTQSKNGKINGKTINEVLWKEWEKVFDNKEDEDITKERDRLIELIKAAKLAK